jgi:hypothetical protein
MTPSPIHDGEHRAHVTRPDHGYKEFSRTSSGGVIYFNPAAPLERRWFIEHEHFGNKYFSKREDILTWTVEQMQARFKAGTVR